MLAFVASACAPLPLTTENFSVIEDKWILPRAEDDMPVWGIRGGIVVGIFPARMSFGNSFGGPRGLFRIGYEKDGVLRFVNYMAVNPVSIEKGRLSPFGSELETSPDDGRNGIQFFAYPIDFLANPGRYPNPPPHNLVAEVVRRPGEMLTWGIRTEPFPNGAECFFIFRIDPRRPYEVEIESHLLKGEKKVKALILSATFGNMTRLRNAYLQGETSDARKIYPGNYGGGFAPRTFWSPNQLPRDVEGDLMFVTGPDEERPWETPPYPHPMRLLQYYRKKSGTWGDDLRAMVNARSRMWKTLNAIPGGVAFENTALVEDYKPGLRFSFGFYHGSVDDLLAGRAPLR